MIFGIGDRVVMLHSEDNFFAGGTVGTVISHVGMRYGVDFGKSFINGTHLHSCGGHCRNTGWFVSPDNLQSAVEVIDVEGLI